MVDGADDGHGVGGGELLEAAVLAAESAPAAWRDLFPVSGRDYSLEGRVRKATEALVARGLLASATGRPKVYGMTEAGKRRAEELDRAFGEDAERVRQIGARVMHGRNDPL
jgi:hypothetical protein